MLDVLFGGKTIVRGVAPADLDRVLPSADCDVWALWSDYFHHYREHLANVQLTPVAAAAPTMQLIPGLGGKSVAVIDVKNVLMKSASWFGTSTVQVRNSINQAAADPNVSGILLAIDSPGGTVAGTAELAGDVRAAARSKPVWAQIQDLGASAAYWVASQADQVFANHETALVGSIGTLMTGYDMSEAAKRAGVEALVFATGPLKGTGFPGSPVLEGQRAYIQGIVNALQNSFDVAVRKGRGLTQGQLETARSGGVFPAAQALEMKLIDGIQSASKSLLQLASAK